jgi:hypothetical protein
VADVVVHECRLRIVRESGWSWGRAPGELVDAALEALPDLAEAIVAGLGAMPAEASPGAPLCLRTQVSLAELERRGADALRAAVANGVRSAAGPAGPANVSGAGATGISERGPTWAALTRAVPLPGPRELLLRWLRAGVLEGLLELLDPATLEVWNAPLRVAPGASPDGAPPFATDARGKSPTSAAALRSRLLLAAAAARSGPSGDTTADVASVAPAEPAGAATPEPSKDVVAEERTVPEPDSPAVPVRPSAVFPPPAIVSPDGFVWPGPVESSAGRGTTAAGETAPQSPADASPAGLARAGPLVVPALPFLVAVPLARIGYFDTLAAALSLARVGYGVSAFAEGLAYKLMDPPERGWRRTAGAERGAAAFTGAEPGTGRLTELALNAPLFASALDAVIAMAVMARRGRQALLLHRAPSGDLVLVDPAGGLLIAVDADVEKIARVLCAGGPTPVRVTGEARRPDVLAALAAAHVPADARRRSARRLAPVLERLEELLVAIELRRSVPLAKDGTLERTLALAAAFGLGSLAWQLWGGAAKADPLLALERLEDLEARVRLEQHRVKVTVPMGRRRQDLADGGILGCVDGLPWLGGRWLELSGG